MAIYNPFDLVVVPFPFTDRQHSKHRPAVVLSTEDFQKDSSHVILGMITAAKILLGRAISLSRIGTRQAFPMLPMFERKFSCWTHDSY